MSKTMVNIADAKANFSKLVERAEQGETILIVRYKRPVARLVPLKNDSRTQRVPGLARGQIWIAPDIEAFEQEIAKEMMEGPVEPQQPAS